MNKECESNFFLSYPWNKSTGDISPYKIFVVILLKEYLKKKDSDAKQSDSKDDDDDGFNVEEKADVPSATYNPDYRRKFYITLLKLIQVSDMSYKDLYSILTTGQHKIDAEHLRRFEQSVSVLSKLGIEVLFKLSKIMDELITDTTTKSNVPIIHHNNSVLGLFFRRILVYLEKMSFQDLMELHRSITMYYEKGIRAIGITQVRSCTIEEIEESTLSKQKWSMKQAEIFINQQSTLLENDEVKALNPKELQKKIDEIIEVYTPLSCKAYFLSYLNNIRIRDLPNSLDALHRSFDKSVGKQGTDNADSASKTHFQYSLLNLAILHTMFEHNDEALSCLNECIMIAQETGDRVCLQLAQLWLCLLDKKNFQLSEKNIANKTEKTLVRSVSLNIQSLVKVAALSGYLPSKLFDVLIKSDILNCQHSIMNLIANCIAERAALWTFYGKHEMASLCSQQLLNSNLKVMDKSHNGEGLCLSLCTVSLWFSKQGEFGASAAILSRAKERFPRFPISKNWLLVEYYVQSIQAIYLEKWSDAAEACDNLYQVCDKNLGILQRAHLNLSRGNRSTTLSLLDILLEQDEDDKMGGLYQIRAMIMQAMCMSEPTNVSAESLLILNRAAILARDQYLDYEHAIVNMHMSYILLKMKMTKEALQAIQLCMEKILANGGIYDKGKVLFLFCQCLIETRSSKEEKLKALNRILDQLNLAIKYFTKLECWQKIKAIYMYVAKLYHELGMTEERNHYSYKFRSIVEEHSNMSNENVTIFY